MTIGYGLGMLAVGIIAIVIGAIIAYFIINALEINSSTISKDSLKSQLNIVRENDSIRYKFLTSISKVSNNDYDNVYNFVRPPSNDNRYISKISQKDAETLTNLILSKYYYY